MSRLLENSFVKNKMISSLFPLCRRTAKWEEGIQMFEGKYIVLIVYQKISYNRHYNAGLEFDRLRFCFHALYSATNLRVWTRVLCFHMTSFKYGAKRVRDDGPICRCHQSHFMSDGTFIIKIAQLLLLFVDTRCSDFSLLYLLASGNLQL